MNNITRTSTTELVMELTKRIESTKAYEEQTGREQALERELTIKTSQAEAWRKEYEKVKKEYRDLEERADSLVATTQRLKRDKPTMPVIPKAVAIAIFREGVQHGVEAACTELEGSEVRVEESEYVGDFHVTFERRIDLDDELDLDWMRDKCGDYSEETVIDALGTLCADKEFECRIHGIDDAEANE